jgi:NitT/TauT family transport system ATP-binding protein
MNSTFLSSGVSRSSTGLQVQDVTIHYWQARSNSAFLVADRISFDVRPGQFVSIVGPSGCGKTTLLKAVDGLIPISDGSMLLGGQPVYRPGPDRAMVFQQPSLLPWRTAFGNVLYGMEIQHRISKKEAQERAQYFIGLVGLHGFEHAYPAELSGGMQQRVNLARALATDPDMLLMDEPFGALDAQTREFMQAELLRIWGTTGKTVLFVTHDISEAVYLSDRVVVLSARPGRVKELVDINLPRPRELEVKGDPAFIRYHNAIWNNIREQAQAAARE